MDASMTHMSDSKQMDREIKVENQGEAAIGRDRPRSIARFLAAATLVFAFGGIGALALTRLPGGGTQAEATDLTEVERAQNDSVQQFADGLVPYTDDDPFSGPAVSGWLSVKPSATSLAPEYDIVRKRVPVHGDAGEVLGYDYTYIGYVPLEIADSPSFDEAAVRADAFGGCDPLSGRDTTDRGCFERGWSKPHAK